MHPKAQLQADLKEAMKSGDDLRKTVIRGVMAAIKNAEVDKREELEEAEAHVILKKEVKMRHESMDEAKGAGRDDLVAGLVAELEILEPYLPAQLPREEIEKLAKAAIEEAGATSPKDTGNVMKALMPKLKGQADGKLVSEVVRELLA